MHFNIFSNFEKQKLESKKEKEIFEKEKRGFEKEKKENNNNIKNKGDDINELKKEKLNINKNNDEIIKH